MLRQLNDMIRSAITRGKVVTSAIGARTVLQATGLDNETLNGVELLLPPGYSARPVAGADVLILQVLGSRDHLVTLGGDNAGQDAITDLALGEAGLRNATGAIQLVLRNTSTIEITGNVTISGNLLVAGDITDNCNTQSETMAGQRAVFNAHDHTVANVQTGGSDITTGVPNQQEP